MQFSNHKKQMVINKYPREYSELVRAYLHGSMERVANLCASYETYDEDEDTSPMKVTDLRLLVEISQDFVAGYLILSKRNVLPTLAQKK